MLTRSQGPVLQFNPEIERTARRLRQEALARRMAEADRRTLLDYIAPAQGSLRSSIAIPALNGVHNFELKPALINMIQSSLQFGGTAAEDPHTHLRKFLRLTDTIKINGVTEDVIRLKLFPFSITERVNDWLNSLPEASITTWEQLQRHFLTQYFPPSVQSRLLTEIASFSQYENESLYEAWERFQELLRRCPHHGYQMPQLVQIFYNSLSFANRAMIDAACGGGILYKPPADTWRVMGELASNSHQWRSSDRHLKKKESQSAGIYQVDQNALLVSQIEAINKKLEALMMAQAQPAPAPTPVSPTPAACSFCGSISHTDDGCMVGAHIAQHNEEANYLGNTYNPSWRNHPNLSWGGRQNQNQGGGPSQNVYVPPHAQTQGGYRPERKEAGHLDALEARVQRLEGEFTALKTSSQNVESQLSQLINMMSQRPPGGLPSQPETNPKEYVNAITLRNGKRYDGPPIPEAEKMVTDAHLVPTDGDKNSDDESKVPVDENSNVMKEKAKPKAEKVPVEPYKPKIPFPQRLKQNLIDPQFSKFLDILKQLKINIPFVEAIAQMPKYAKFLKEILSNKKKLAEFETIALSEECSAIVLKKLPPKLKDPGSFTIPCTIGGSYFDKALCDLGASINLMPFSVFKRLGMKEPKPTTISLQLADRSITYPRGIVEDVLVKVGKFIFPTDFVVMDMEEDEDVPIILGRPFLYTGSAIIDMRRGRLTFSIDDEEEEFIVFGPSKHFPPSENGKVLNSVDSMSSSKCSLLQELPIQDTVKKKNTSIGKQASEAPEGMKNKPFERGKEYFKSSGQGAHHCEWRGIQEHYPSSLKNYKFDAHGS